MNVKGKSLILAGGLLAAGALLCIPACTRDLVSPATAPSGNPAATNTPSMPTATPTAVPPTSTNTPSAATATNTPAGPTATNTPVPPTATPTCASTTTPALIDDMEDNNNQILANECRNGTWYSYSDTAGSSIVPAQGASFTMTSPGYTGSGYAAEVTGNLIPSNAGNSYAGYAGLGFNFLLATNSFYAIPSNYTGFTFYAKVGSTSQITNINAVITDYETAGTSQGGQGAGGPYGTGETLTTAWTQYTVPMSGANWKNTYGGPTTFLPGQAQALQFQLVPDSAATMSYDLWVDQVSFY